MTQSRKPIIALGLSALLLTTACTDPAHLAGSQDYDKTRQGAAVGAGLGAVLGAMTARKGDRGKAAVKGAIIGGIGGGAYGAYLDKQEKDLRASVGNDVQIRNTGDRLIVTLPQDILFTTDSDTLRPDLVRDIRAVASNLQAYPKSTVQVLGHTDSDGDAGYNMGLSQRRAQAVADVLTGEGVAMSRVQPIGRGEDQPVASNLSAAGKQQNRRVEIVILPSA